MKKLILTAAVLCLPAMIAQAETPLFNQLDVDKNGFISKEEAKANSDLTELFATLDADLDSQLSLEEYAAIVKKES